MSCQIFATLENGMPTLDIVDVNTKETVLHWQYDTQHPDRVFERNDVLSLFRQLILLTCKQQASNNRLFTTHPHEPSTS